MKRATILGIMTLFILGLSSASFAHNYSKVMGVSYKTIEGTVISVNPEKNTFVFKCNQLGTQATYTGYADQLSALKAGDLAKVTLRQGSNIARIASQR